MTAKPIKADLTPLGSYPLDRLCSPPPYVWPPMGDDFHRRMNYGVTVQKQISDLIYARRIPLNATFVLETLEETIAETLK